MCGRYYRRSDKQAIADHFGTGGSAFDLDPSYNVAPQTMQPIVRIHRDTGERELAMLRWGLVPFWAKDPKIAYSTINAKAESVVTSPTYREAFQRRRCLVPADGFYEWRKLDPKTDKTKQPYAIALKDRSLYAFAGVWETWRDRVTREPLQTYSILTTEPNELAAAIHNRMPLILARRDYARWLAPADPEQLPIDLLRPYPAEGMVVWQVSKDVGNVRNDRPDLVDEV